MQLDGVTPPASIAHRGDTYRLIGFDDPNWPESFALYAHPKVDAKSAVDVALAT